MNKHLIIDSHQDLAYNTRQVTGKDFFKQNNIDESHILKAPQLNQSDFERLRIGGAKVVFGVIFPYRDDEKGDTVSSPEFAQTETQEQIDFYHGLEKKDDRVKIIKTKQDLETVMNSSDMLGIILLLEDALGIDYNLVSLQKLYNDGLRIIGPVWNNDNQFGGGTDSELGLTEKGKQLLVNMEQIGFVLDTAHMNPTMFWDSLAAFSGHIINSHTCAHAQHPHKRNLNDKQLLALAERNAVVGIAFVPSFLSSHESATSLSDLTRHINHMVAILGSDRVGLGSDFDGMSWPRYIENVHDVTCYGNVINTLDPTIWEKVAYKNWLDFLYRVL